MAKLWARYEQVFTEAYVQSTDYEFDVRATCSDIVLAHDTSSCNDNF